MRIVIIGLGTAAFAAILAIRKLDRESTITVLDKKEFDLQHSCGLPYALEAKINIEQLEHFVDSKHLKLNILHQCEAISIGTEKKEVEYRTKENAIEHILYDKLLLDTGSTPFIPPIPGLKEHPNLACIKETIDVKNLEKKLLGAKTAIVIGAGAIGIETAFALMKRNLKVTIIESLDALFPRAIDQDLSQILEAYLNQSGISILLNKKIEKIDSDGIVLDSGKISADIVVTATGVRSNTKLASGSGILVTQNGIIVNKNMQTSNKDIYAAGDCIESVNLISGQKYSPQLATTAYRQGTIAGENIANKNNEYDGSISTFVSVIGDMEIASTGLNSKTAKSAGFEVIVGKSSSTDKPEWYSQEEKVTIKILADKKTGKILGAQGIGKNAYSRINVVSTAIAAGMTLKSLSAVELSYCPAVSQTYDVLMQAVDFGIRRLGN